jgi:hypothetical protein
MTPPVVTPRFALLEPVRAGCDSVWSGVEVETRRPVAIKAVPDGREAERQASLCRSVAHPGLPALLHSDVTATTPYLVFDLAPNTLSQVTLELSTPDGLRAVFRDVLGAALELATRGLEHTAIAHKHILLHWGRRASLCGIGWIRDAGSGFADPQASHPAAARIALSVGLAMLGCIAGVTDADVPERALFEPRRWAGERNPEAVAADPILVGLIEALLSPQQGERLHPAIALAVLEGGQRIHDIRPPLAFDV